MTGIYIIKNKINNKVYIGQSVRLQQRMNEHKRNSSNPHLKNAIELYGIDNFSFDILCECKEEELDNLEIQYIKKFDSTNPDKGYNIQVGGCPATAVKRDDFRRYLSDLAKKRVSCKDYINPATGTTLIHKGEKTSRCKLCDIENWFQLGWDIGPSDLWRDQHRSNGNTDYFKNHKYSGTKNGFYGKHHSEESKQKIRSSMPDTSFNWRGKHHSEESKQKMRGPRPSVTGVNNPNYGKRGKSSVMHGRRVINDGNNEKRVYSKDLDFFLSAGWKLGRLPKVKLNLAEIGKNSISGKIMMNNGEINKYFTHDEVNNQLKSGWKVGKLK